ncbi:glycosyltransferase [Gimesia maris]|uniref:glycosyltransferase n=1 Tax=Gimesia maris TaxID=122 RepID=UPI0018D7706C|nr:glycosyltransferase [Gimesia maris]
MSLVIPGRNCAQTLEKCLNSVVPLLERGELEEILFVDDGSTDKTAEIARRYPVQVIKGTGSGPGAARNLGWRQAQGASIWFIDSDCVAEPDTLQKLLPHLNDPDVAGVGGSYANLYPDSLLATLIHEEIVARHRRMPQEVNFLGGFNVLYRHAVLDELNGFDESETNGPGAAGAEDCDFSFRAVRSKHRLHFEFNSHVGHHHPRNLWRYMQTQARHGYYRILLHLRHPEEIGGDSYAGFSDYLQPPLAALSVATLPVTVFDGGWLVSSVFALLQLLLQIPMTLRLIWQSDLRMLAFPAFGFIRAYFRLAGMVPGVWSVWRPGSKPKHSSPEAKSCKLVNE